MIQELGGYYWQQFATVVGTARRLSGKGKQG